MKQNTDCKIALRETKIYKASQRSGTMVQAGMPQNHSTSLAADDKSEGLYPLSYIMSGWFYFTGKLGGIADPFVPLVYAVIC